MSVGPLGEAAFRGWDADGWDDLRAIWDDLIPARESSPLFRDHDILTPQQRGWIFERRVMEAFRLSGAATEHRHRNPMATDSGMLEEIDGLVFDGWQAFLVEAKYERHRVGIDPIFRLHLMAEQRPVGTLGLFFSISGFTSPAPELSERLRPIRVLLFAAKDIEWALRVGAGMMELVREKWTRAVRSGRPHSPDRRV